ncbi:MAG: AIPR family protein [Nitrosomonas sp.]|nr:AIPR family protein [Nitrosomonas sp.]
MELEDFLRQTQSEVQAEIGERLSASGDVYPYPESVFAEIVMQHMCEIGMTFEPEVCHYSSRIGNAQLRLSGFAVSDDADQLDLFVSLYSGDSKLQTISDTETKTAAEQCLRFLAKCADGKLASTMDESNDAYALTITIQNCYSNLDQIRIYVLTDRQAKAKNFKAREVSGKTVKLEVMDIERLHRHWSEGKPRDELIVNFNEVCGDALPCVYVPGEMTDYDYALTVIPGEALYFIYEKYGARLLEANVRSFLSIAGKVNKGIRDTLRNDPERFMAYNNGIVIVADEAFLGKTLTGGPGILWLKGMQIVNGGQTTASIYFTKKKLSEEVNLRQVRVPAKIIVLHSSDDASEESLISDISRFANSQNSVKQSDLSANKPFHVEMEKLAQTTYCPDGIGRWFYERASGSYNTMLAREGTTPSRLKQLKEQVIPPSRKITKTDLAKYLNIWDQKPDLVSLGSQKNFERFMDGLKEPEEQSPTLLPDVSAYKTMIAKAILFKKTQAIVRPMFPAFQGNVAIYLLSLLANRVGDRMDFERIWLHQDISPSLRTQLQIWAVEVNRTLHNTSVGRMISEWAKKPECWYAVKSANYSPIQSGIPELR